MKKISIIGDSSCVKEYAALAKSCGYSTAQPTKRIALALELTNLSSEQKKKNLRRLESGLGRNATIMSSSTTITVNEQATWLTYPERLVGIGALPSLLEGNLLELVALEQTSVEAKRAAEHFAGSLGKEVAFVGDSVGLVMPRILCALANEACFAMMERIADSKEIDIAMKLGTNYPRGPVEWAERIGWEQVLAVMEALHRHFGEDRYRPAPLLRTLGTRHAG